MSRLDQLRSLVRENGQAAMQLNQVAVDIGQRLACGLNAYLGAPGKVVRQVPPVGRWEPEKDYGADAFDAITTLRPVRMGLAVRLDNLEDAGAAWIRVVIIFRRIDAEGISVEAPRGRLIRLSVKDEGGGLEEVFEAIVEDLTGMLRAEMEPGHDGLYADGRIGFYLA